MIEWFLIALFSTLIIVRVFAHLFHDRKNYGKYNEKSKTITRYLRRKTGLDVHHIHIGVIMLLILIPWLFYVGLNKINLVLLGISLSLIADQILPLFGFGNYFSKKMLIGSVILHILIAAILLIIL